MTLIDSIYKTPEDWCLSIHTLNHKKGARLWVGNGILFCSPYPGGSYDLMTKFRAWRAYRWWLRNAPVEALKPV